MAANDEIEKKKIKIELDIKQAKEQLDSLGKGIKQSEDRLKNLSKLLGGQLSDMNKYQRKNTIGAAGFTVGQWNQMSENQKLKTRVSLERDLTTLLQRRAAVENNLHSLNAQYSKANERILKTQIKDLQNVNKELEKQNKNEEKQQNRIAQTARARQSAGLVGGMARGATRRISNQLAWRIGNFGITTAISAAKFAGEASSQMEDWLSETQAVAGSTSGTMAQLAKSIYEVGSNSRFTTEELTKATTILAQAGYSAEDISKLLGSVNSLATATGTDLKTSVDLLTSSMSLWTSQTSDAARMVDALVVAVNTSKAEISSIQKGMQYAGAAASQMGMSFNETVAAMSAVTNAGLKTRSIMGTGLRAVLTELSDPSKKLQKELEKVGLTISDVNVRTKGFSNVMQTLADAGFGAENAFRGLDRQAASFYLALKSQLDLNNQLLETMERRGVAEKAEQVRMDTTIAQLGRLKNVWFEIFSTAGSPLNSAFKFVVTATADASEILASALESFKSQAQDADTVIERTTAELDSMKTSAQALAEEMWKLAQQNIGSDAVKASKAHANLTDRFNNERKVVQGLSQDYKQLKQYMLDIAVAQERESLNSERQRIGANLQNVQKFSSEMKYLIGHSNRRNIRGDLQNLYSSLGLTPGESYQKVSSKLQTMPIEQLQSLIYTFQSGTPVRGTLERLLTSRQEIQRGMTRITGAPNEETFRKELSSISNITDSVTKFMGGTQYKQLSDRLKDWSGASSQKDIGTLLKTIDTFRGYMKTLDETANKYPQSLEIQTQTSTAREKLFENIQTLETQITNVATKAMEDIEKDLKNQSQTNKQGVIEKFMEKLEGMLGVSSSGKSWLDSTIDQLQNAKADEGLIEALKQLREKVLSGLLKSAEVAYKNTIESANLSAGVSEAAQKYKKVSGGYDRGATAVANLNYIQAQLTATKDALESVKNSRKTTYKEYSDDQFSSLTNPLEEQVVKLELDEKAATEEVNRTGGNGTWAAMSQSTEDYFRELNKTSSSYNLTLSALNSTSSGLKKAFSDIATEGMSVSQAFRDMTTSILQALANAAINEGVNSLMSAIFMGVKGAAGGAGGASGSSGGGTPTTPTREVSNVGFASGGGYVDGKNIRRFAIGGAVSGRDSVPAMLMPGEYVMKKSAVDMIGRETLDAMNQATSRASNDKASNVRESKKPSPVVTNVYVVQDKQDAGMTPNDVVVAVSRDILQGGQTRQLIQQVVQGRY